MQHLSFKFRCEYLKTELTGDHSTPSQKTRWVLDFFEIFYLLHLLIKSFFFFFFFLKFFGLLFLKFWIFECINLSLRNVGFCLVLCESPCKACSHDMQQDLGDLNNVNGGVEIMFFPASHLCHVRKLCKLWNVYR